MNPQTPQLPRTLRICLAAVIGLACAATNTAYAQISTINSVVVQPRVLDDLPNAGLTIVTNYPALISFTETNVSTTNTAFLRNQDLWQFSVDGQTNAYVFSASDVFTVSMTVTLTGSPTSPRKEAGFAFNDVAGNISGQYILDTDAGEVVAFGGPLPFYQTALDHFYVSGEPITMAITILTDTNGKPAIIYTADGFSSPPIEFTPQTNYTLGGYFQIVGTGAPVTNHGSATFANISISALPNGLGIAGTQIAQAVSITGTQLTQSAPSDNGKTTTTKAASRTAITTATVLADLAKDENAAGKYSATTFPAGAKLLYTADAGFVVVDKHGVVLVNVANILTLEPAGKNDITSGTFVDANGSTTPPFTQTELQLATLTYDATSVGGTRKVAVTGLGTSVTTTSNPNSKGHYTESDSFSLLNGTGEGVDGDGVKIVVTGFTISARGTAAF